MVRLKVDEQVYIISNKLTIKNNYNETFNKTIYS